MMIKRLVELYENLNKVGKVPDINWQIERVSYGININKSGELLNIIPLFSQEQIGVNKKDNSPKFKDVPYEIFVPERYIRGSNIQPNFICDNSSYLLGFDNKSKDNAVKKFKESKKLHISLLSNFRDDFSIAIVNFFLNWDYKNATKHSRIVDFLDEIEKGPNLIFMMNGVDYASNSPNIKKAWDSHKSKSEYKNMTCAICGKNGPIERIHGKIRGVFGGQSSGTSLISSNADSFESYGLNNIPSVPICRYDSFAYVSALNYLFSNKNYHIKIGEKTILFWSDKIDDEKVQIFTESMNFSMPEQESNDEKIKNIVKQISQGNMVNNNLEGNFYILGITPNVSRLSVSFFYDKHFGSLLKNISAHFEKNENNWK